MNRREFFGAVPAAVLLAHQSSAALDQTGRKGVMLMNRIGPSSAELYIANADGTGERKFLQNSIFEYNACFSADGESVLFTSERNGSGQSDVFRARLDGTDIEPRGHRPGGRRCGRALARWYARRLRLDAAMATARISGCSTWSADRCAT